MVKPAVHNAAQEVSLGVFVFWLLVDGCLCDSELSSRTKSCLPRRTIERRDHEDDCQIASLRLKTPQLHLFSVVILPSENTLFSKEDHAQHCEVCLLVHEQATPKSENLSCRILPSNGARGWPPSPRSCLSVACVLLLSTYVCVHKDMLALPASKVKHQPSFELKTLQLAQSCFVFCFWEYSG